MASDFLNKLCTKAESALLTKQESERWPLIRAEIPVQENVFLQNEPILEQRILRLRSG